jgi:hypothetical protein
MILKLSQYRREQSRNRQDSFCIAKAAVVILCLAGLVGRRHFDMVTFL